MATFVDTERLAGTDGFLVESPAGELGWVERVCRDEREQPCALAVETVDGRHGLLLQEDVVAVDRERRFVAVPPEPVLRELVAPPSNAGDRAWATTGAVLPAPAPADDETERPLWQVVVLLYASLALLVTIVIALAFVAARLAGGAAY